MIENVNEFNIETLLENKEEERLFLFLEADYFENAKDEIEEMDINANTTLLWENSRLWHEHKYNGPLIVETSNDSPIFKKFIEEWVEENRGVILRSKYSLKQVTQHLQSLIFVTEPDETLTRLRLYEPRKLRGVLNAMQELNELSELMGSIEEFIWLENCALEERWFMASNPQVHSPRYNIHDENWFVFTEEQNEIIEEHEEWYFCTRLSYELKRNFQISIPQQEVYEQIVKLNQEAKEQQFFVEDDKETYIKLRLEFGNFRQDIELEKILNNPRLLVETKLYELEHRLQESRGMSI